MTEYFAWRSIATATGRPLHLMKRAGDEHLPCTVTVDYAIKLLRPMPTNESVFLSAKVVGSAAN